MPEYIEEVNKNTNRSNGNSIILGYWDYEKTPFLIRDLEDSLNLIEKKCENLLHQLTYYKHHWEELQNVDLLTTLSTTKANSINLIKNTRFPSSSVPDLLCQKETQKYELEKKFKEKFQKKLIGLNKALSEASHKIGLQKNCYLFPINGSSEKSQKRESHKTKISDNEIKKNFIKTYLEGKTKSDSVILETPNNLEFSKISKKDFELYEKLSKIGLSKNKFKFLSKKKKVYSSVKKANLKFKKFDKKHKLHCRNQVTERKSSRSSNEIDCKSVDKLSKCKKICPSINGTDFKMKEEKHRTINNNENLKFKKVWVEDSKKGLESGNKGVKMLQASISNNNYELTKPQKNLKIPPETIIIKNPVFDKKPAFLKKKELPFVPCKSTSKSFNIGTNLQQVLSLKKYAKSGAKIASRISKIIDEDKEEKVFEKVCESVKIKKPETQEKIEIYPTTNENLTQNETRKKSVASFPYFVTTYPRSPRNDNIDPINNYKTQNVIPTFNNAEQVEQKEKSWSSKFLDSHSDRKTRSKYTKTSPERFIRYNKSKTEEYTNEKESMVKSECKTACAVGSKIVVSDSTRTDFYDFESPLLCINASGDHSENMECKKINTEWNKVLSLFTDLHRMYSSLKKQSNENGLIPSDKTLKSLEIEIDGAIEKYKEFLKIYNKFLCLKHRLKSLKNDRANESSYKLHPSVEHHSWKHEKNTHSDVIAQTLKQIQCLHDRIKLIKNI